MFDRIEAQQREVDQFAVDNARIHAHIEEAVIDRERFRVVVDRRFGIVPLLFHQTELKERGGVPLAIVQRAAIGEERAGIVAARLPDEAEVVPGGEESGVGVDRALEFDFRVFRKSFLTQQLTELVVQRR